MKKQLMIIALAVGFMLPTKAQIVQTMKLENGSELYGYMKTQKPGSACTFHAEEAVVVLDGAKVKSINGKKVAYNNLSEEWKHYADEKGTLDKKREMNMSAIDTGAIINDVFVLEQGRTVRYVELKRDYVLHWDEIAFVESEPRDEMLISGINHLMKMKDGHEVYGQNIKEIPGETTTILREDGVKESVEKNDIIKDNFIKNNPDQSIFEQSKLLDEIRMKDGTVYTGIITEQNYEQSPYFFIMTMMSGSVETTVSLRMKDVAEYGKIVNPDYREVRDILLNPGQILVNGNEAELVKLSEQSNGYVVAPSAKRVNLKQEGHNLEVTIQANFKDEKEAKDNYFIKTRTYENDKKRAGWYYFKYKDLIESSIQPNESGTSLNNTTKATYTVTSKGVYVFYNSNTKKAVVIVVE
ncbi:MAG: hypothetical protein IJ622_09130 [Bacteroidales bacterium]|nr:hypothetical protein [Bacteroidales bacterium]